MPTQNDDQADTKEYALKTIIQYANGMIIESEDEEQQEHFATIKSIAEEALE